MPKRKMYYSWSRGSTRNVLVPKTRILHLSGVSARLSVWDFSAHEKLQQNARDAHT